MSKFFTAEEIDLLLDGEIGSKWLKGDVLPPKVQERYSELYDRKVKLRAEVTKLSRRVDSLEGEELTRFNDIVDNEREINGIIASRMTTEELQKFFDDLELRGTLNNDWPFVTKIALDVYKKDLESRKNLTS